MFKNFKVIAYMGSPIATIDNIILDSIISCAVAKEQLGDEFYNGSNKYGTKEQLDDWLGEIIDKKQRVFCSSIGFGDTQENTTSWSKRFDVKNDDLIAFKGKGKERLDIGAGHFKNYHMPLVIRSYKTITFYIRGDLNKIKELLENHIHYLGKKGSQGYGEVLKWDFIEIENDYSLWKDNKPMRPIPANECIDYIENNNYNMRSHAIIPPYWRNDNIELCIMPSEVI